MKVILLRAIAAESNLTLAQTMLVVQTLINKGIVDGQIRQIGAEIVLLALRLP